MMAILVVIFLSMFVYGVLTAHAGAGIISLLCAIGCFMIDRDVIHWRTCDESKDDTGFSDPE